MSFLLRGLFAKQLATKTVAPAVEKIAVIEKQSLLKSSALSVGGGIVKTGALVSGLGAVGYVAQDFKNSLFSGLNGIGGGALGNLGGLTGGLSDIVNGATTDITTGLMIVGGCLVIGVLYKISNK